MSGETIGLPPALSAYLQELSAVDEHPVLEELRRRTAPMADARMQISVEQGRWMQWLVRSLGARRCVEVGTFTGYSALAVALVLPEGGELVACDVSEEWTAIGREYWERAGVAGKIDLRIGPAAETLRAMLEAGKAGSFDFAFVDADKAAYPTYAELGGELLRVGGVIAFDNAFLGGRVVAPEADDEGAIAMRALLDQLAADPAWDVSLLPISDGLLLARKLG